MKKKKARKSNKSYLIIVLIAFLLTVVAALSFLYEKGILKKFFYNPNSEYGVPDYVTCDIISFGKSRSGEKLQDVKNIVVHYVANPMSSAKNNRDYFNSEESDVCSHFVIGLDGEIILCLPLDEKSAASNNRNSDTISVEVCHPDKTGKFNEKTYASLVKLCGFLTEKFSLEATDIIRHYDITGKKCPLYYVENPDEWQKFISDVASFEKND